MKLSVILSQWTQEHTCVHRGQPILSVYISLRIYNFTYPRWLNITVYISKKSTGIFLFYICILFFLKWENYSMIRYQNKITSIGLWGILLSGILFFVHTWLCFNFARLAIFVFKIDNANIVILRIPLYQIS